MSILEDLQAAFPGKTVTYIGAGYLFVPDCDATERVTALMIIDAAKGQVAQSRLDILGLGQWATWTLADFETWCNDNLMLNAAIDALTLNADLKKNIKAINLFVRNGGKMLIAIRNVIFWLLKLSGVNGS